MVTVLCSQTYKPMYLGGEEKSPKLIKGKLTQRAMKRLAVGARCAIKMHSKTGDVEKLRKDLQNCPSQVFNDHTNCSTSFCKVTAGVSSSSSRELGSDNGPISNQTSNAEVETDNSLAGSRQHHR